MGHLWPRGAPALREPCRPKAMHWNHRSLTHAVSGGQAFGSGASKGQQPIDEPGLGPLRFIYGEPLLEASRGADSSPRETYGLGEPPALREPCRPKAAGGGLAQGRVILA
jgi:hypothetical protein